MIIEEEFDILDMYEDGSGPSEDIMIQRHYAKMAEENELIIEKYYDRMAEEETSIKPEDY
jgi:hypothetical protein